jgi:hypothetical protein
MIPESIIYISQSNIMTFCISSVVICTDLELDHMSWMIEKNKYCVDRFFNSSLNHPLRNKINIATQQYWKYLYGTVFLSKKNEHHIIIIIVVLT